MKLVFYRTLLSQGWGLTPTEGIMYSFLVSKSLLMLNECYELDGGSLNMSVLCDLVDDEGCVDMYEISIRKFAQVLNVTPRTIINGMHHLEALGLIRGSMVYVDVALVSGGYFELHHHDVLSGQLLVFYSYLRDRADVFDGSIDTHKARLSELFGVKVYSIKQYFSRLYKANLIERLKNGKLRIL